MSSGVLISESLECLGATYCSILSFDQDNNLIYKKSSNPEWAEEFASHDFYKNCHLLIASQEMLKVNKGDFVVAWDMYKPFTAQAHQLDEIRKNSNMCHGVGFCFQSESGHTLVNIAGAYHDINFGLNVLKNKKEAYKELYKNLVLFASES